MRELELRLANFYWSWQALESGPGGGAASVIDFDYCQLGDRAAPPFADRLEALGECRALLAELSAGAGGLGDPELAKARLAGSAAYLEALLGARWPFEQYLEACMGIAPEPVGPTELGQLAERVEAALWPYGLTMEPDCKSRYDAVTRFGDLGAFAPALRAAAASWLERIGVRFGLTESIDYTVESVEENAYWMNWIDGRRGQPTRLRVNAHPRNTFRLGSAESLAAHEIAGHALHVACLDRACGAGRLDGAAMHLTVHDCLSFQMEGLAQTVMLLTAEEGEISREAALFEALSAYHLALLNNAQLELEAGAEISAVVTDLERAAPFMERRRMLADLADRARNPLYRSYMHVYWPSRRTFLEASSLAPPERATFLREMYLGLYTPRRIRERLAELKSSGQLSANKGS